MKQNFLIIIVAIIIAVLVAGSGVYWWQESVLEKAESEKQQQVDNLQAQLNQIKLEKEALQKEKEDLIPKNSLIHKDFSYPYPISWTWKEEIREADFSLTAVSLGERTIPSSVQSSSYISGDKVNALTLYFKINTHWEDVGVCLPTEFRMILNEEGDTAAPINNRFNIECPMGNRTYSDQEVIFVVPGPQEEFILTTGGKSNIFFNVMAYRVGDLKVEKIPSNNLE